MRFSDGTELAIHGLWWIAQHERQGDGEPALLSHIAEAQGVSESYLAKVFQRLAHAGLLVSKRGKSGGFQLGRAADDIRIGQVARIFEGESDDEIHTCADGKRGCLARSHCGITDIFGRAINRMFETLNEKSIGDLVREASNPIARIERTWLR
jgi:Rrf2 family nitric oxide-sensitive transcriptional repressor